MIATSTARRWTTALVRMMLVALLMATAAPAAAAATADAAHVTVRLVPQSKVPAPGASDTFAIDVMPQRGWHIYWRNPGESGYAPRLSWHLPAGITAAPVRHPVPTMMSIGGIASNVHVGRTILLDTLHFPATLSRGATVPIGLDLDLLTCSEDMCVPQSLALQVTLKAGNGNVDEAVTGLFVMARKALPRPASGPAREALANGKLTVAIQLGSKAVQPVRLFLDQAGLVKTGAAQHFVTKGGYAIITIPSEAKSPPRTLGGVLSFRRADGSIGGLQFAAAPGVAANADRPSMRPAPILLALGGAVLGGLLLNLMPCVFPILSLKAMALARSGGEAGEARAEALGYTIGAVAMIVALGATILALRAAGASIGWAFQLQDPRIVALLLLLIVAIATNLAGLYELPSLQLGSRSTSGFAGGLGTGALAAFVATPCSGPFMAGALGAALMLPTIAALAIFAGLGLGLALPFLVIGFIEPARRWLPRPGVWMVTLRHLLSLPMFATAIGLAWLLGRQAGVTAMTFGLAAAMALGLALWWRGHRQHRGRGGIAPMAGVAAAIAVALAVPAGAAPTGSAAAQSALETQSYSAKRLAMLRAKGRPVFLYLTADWCLTCKVNEASTIDSAAVAQAFKAAHVAVLRGDWSDGSPAITALLERYHRAGVPLYLFYRPGKNAVLLPQILTPAIVMHAVNDA